MTRTLFAIVLALSGLTLAWPQSDRNHPFYTFRQRDENRWLLEKSISSKKYMNDHHKKAVKSAKAGNWGISLMEYEAAAREVNLRYEKPQGGTEGEVALRNLMNRLESELLSPFRFELALAYANRADELQSFGRSREADSLAELAVFCLERIEVYASDRLSAGTVFASLAAAFGRLGHYDRAILYYRNALIYIEGGVPMSDPLQAIVNVRLGQLYLLAGKLYESEPPLLRGTEFTDSAAAVKSSYQSWCRQLAAEGKAFLGETCRLMDRVREAESLYAESMSMALASTPPMILPQCRPLYENYAKILRGRGDIELADSVNYHTDLIQRRAEDEVERQSKRRQP